MSWDIALSKKQHEYRDYLLPLKNMYFEYKCVYFKLPKQLQPPPWLNNIIPKRLEQNRFWLFATLYRNCCVEPRGA